MEENKEQRDVSRYNAALLQLQRIHSLWISAQMFCDKGRMHYYRWMLDRIWIELSADATEREFKLRAGIEKRINNILRTSRTEAERKNRLFHYLQDIYDIFLRKVEKREGKGSSYVDVSQEDIK